ncbi:MAG TPA: retroviral-like aspartic protease family protein [Pyrinomonadaceae bacterium]|jgi:predicted aspartyl protease
MTTEINFRLAGGPQPLILVPVKVNGQGAYDFILDTGAGTSLLSSELARSLGVEGTETKEGQVAGGKVSVPVGSVASLAIGEARVDNLQVAIIDLSDVGRAVGAQIDGDIGYNFLKEFRVTIDYRRNRLRLAKGLYESVGAAALKEVAFRLAAPVKPLLLVNVVINGGLACEFAIDTGCSTTMISPELASSLEVAGVPIPPITTGGAHQVEASVGSLASLAVGESLTRNLQVVIADTFSLLNRATGANFNGIIGYNFLKEFTVTIDYPNERLSLSR